VNSFLSYTLSKKCADFWTVILLGLLLYASVRLEISHVRLIVGFVFVLLGPGYALFRLIFVETKSLLETLTYSFGLSMVVVPIIGYGLNFSLGIYTDTVMISIIASTFVLLFGAIVRRFFAEDKKS